MQIAFVGLFSVKGLRAASIASFPLPFLTWLFHEHCRQRFLPVFKNFNLEVPFLLPGLSIPNHSSELRRIFLPYFLNYALCWQSTAKKDIADEEDGRTDEILNKIRDAYLHPALQYVDLNVDQNSKTQRLLPESSDYVEPEIPV